MYGVKETSRASMFNHVNSIKQAGVEKGVTWVDGDQVY